MHLDASGIIHSWDNYPIANFPPFWDWIAAEIAANNFAICDVALEEVGHNSPECAEWLKNRGIRKIPLTEDILLRAAELKDLLGIAAENYHADGVDENDLFIIAAAAIEADMLLTEESRQPTLPVNRARYKIPAVCEMDDVGVTSTNVRELIISSGMVFR